MAGASPEQFAVAHAAAPPGAPADWGRLTVDCVTQLGALAGAADLGFVYATDALAAHLPQIVALLRQSSGVKTWVGSVGLGIATTGTEYFDRPALAVMVASWAADAWRLIPNLEDEAADFESLRAWARGVASGTMSAPPFGIVHADPRNPQLPKLVADLADAVSGFLVGGLTSSRGPLDQVAGQVVHGGLSGVLLAPKTHEIERAVDANDLPALAATLNTVVASY